jgi:hypothetical protein
VQKRARYRMIRKALFILDDLGQQFAWGEGKTERLM